jgi:hypothetical protein
MACAKSILLMPEGAVPFIFILFDILLFPLNEFEIELNDVGKMGGNHPNLPSFSFPVIRQFPLLILLGKNYIFGQMNVKNRRNDGIGCKWGQKQKRRNRQRRQQKKNGPNQTE